MNSIAAHRKETSTVCLLDDDPSVLKATSRLLSSAGWEVETFTDPHSFLRYAERQLPPVAVIDIWMPRMNGLEVQARLRRVSPSTQIIVLTGKDDPSIRSSAIDAGASAFFLKDLDDDALLAGVASAIAKK
jgi:FixJ family two-component response regulator